MNGPLHLRKNKQEMELLLFCARKREIECVEQLQQKKQEIKLLLSAQEVTGD
jgi:hypothetical protein